MDDLALAFHYLNLNLNDIREYIDYVGPPENVTNIPKYPVPPPSILNVKRTLAEDLEAHTSATDHLQPKAEDSEDEEQFRGFFQYNREFKTEITGGTEDGSGDVKKENESGDVKPTIGGDEGRSNGDSKHDALKKASGGAARAPIKRKLTAVQMTPGEKFLPHLYHLLLTKCNRLTCSFQVVVCKVFVKVVYPVLISQRSF